jgi:hypothetical protein
MKDLFIFFAVLNAITLFSLLFYFPLVWLNLVFTFNELSVSDIPYYNTDLDCFVLTCFFFSQSRYHWLWWEIATDGLRVFIPILPLYNILLILLFKWKLVFWSYTFPMCLLATIEIFKCIKITFGFAICNEIQSCRNFGSANPDEASYKANYVYLTYWAFSVVFVLLCIIYGSLGERLTNASFSEKIKKSI